MQSVEEPYCRPRMKENLYWRRKCWNQFKDGVVFAHFCEGCGLISCVLLTQLAHQNRCNKTAALTR